MAKPLDLEGRVFDRLLVLKQISSKRKRLSFGSVNVLVGTPAQQFLMP